MVQPKFNQLFGDLRLAIMALLSSAITGDDNGILMLTLKTDYHIV